MTPDEARLIAEAASERTIEKFFLKLGIDTTDAEAIIEAQADFMHIRRWRQATDTVKRQTLKAAVAALAAGAVGYFLVFVGWKTN